MSRGSLSVLRPDTEPVGDEAPDLGSNTAEPFMCAGMSIAAAKKDGERRAAVVSCCLRRLIFFFFPLPARATLTDVNEARAHFPGGIKAALPADTARDFAARLPPSLWPPPPALCPTVEWHHKRGMSQRDFNCRGDRGHFSGRRVVMACYAE